MSIEYFYYDYLLLPTYNHTTMTMTVIIIFLFSNTDVTMRVHKFWNASTYSNCTYTLLPVLHFKCRIRWRENREISTDDPGGESTQQQQEKSNWGYF